MQAMTPLFFYIQNKYACKSMKNFGKNMQTLKTETKEEEKWGI